MITIQFSQEQSDSWSDIWGTKDYYWNCGVNPCPTKVSSQSVTPENDFQFNRAVVKLKHSGWGMVGANIEMMVLNNKIENNQDMPDFNSAVVTSAIKSIYNPDENKEVVFSFDAPVSLSGDNKYWFVLDVNNYSSSGNGFYENRNNWQNILASNDVYPAGEAAKATFGGGNFQIISGSDWYLKLALIL